MGLGTAAPASPIRTCDRHWTRSPPLAPSKPTTAASCGTATGSPSWPGATRHAPDRKTGLTPILAKLVDFGISMLIILGVILFYRIMPTWNLLLLPLFILEMMSIAAGVGLWLSAMAIRFRDVKLAMPFVIRMLMYTAPIVYSAASIPEMYRTIYSLNPLVGVIEGFRACLLGTPFPWQFIWPGMLTALILFVSGAFYFKRMERVFVDVI